MKLTKLLRLFSILIISLLLGSCASTSKASEGKSKDAKTFSAAADKGTVYLYRTGRALGAAGQLLVKVNSTDAGG